MGAKDLKELDQHYFHSINFPCEWGERRKSITISIHVTNFHSINFPCEWGVYGASEVGAARIIISIQLISPASGEDRSPKSGIITQISIQLISPASGEIIKERNR